MNQKKLLLILAVAAVLILAVTGLGVGGAELGWFGGGAQSARHLPGEGAQADTGQDAEAADIEANIAGRDEHGDYRIGEFGERVYRDEQGRCFVVDADGTRRFTDARGRSKTDFLRGTGEGMQSRPLQRPSRDAPGETPPEEAAPVGTALLTGSVVDEDGKPFGGVTVTAQLAGEGRFEAATDGEGEFSIPGLPKGKPLNVSAKSDVGAVSNTVTTTLEGDARLPAPLVLARDSSIRGIVQSSEGGAVAGAEIVLFEGADKFGLSTRVRATSQSGAGGEFAFSSLPQAFYRLQVSHDGFAPVMVASITPPRALEIMLSPGAAVSGRVTGADGAPIKSALVSCDFESEPAQKFHTEAHSDVDGHFAVRCQPESQQNVIKVMAPGFHARSRHFVRSGATGIDFKLQPTGNVILRGRILRASGEAVAQATLSALDAENRNARIAQRIGPAADGAFWAEVVPAGVRLRVRSAGLAERIVDYTPIEGGEVQLGDIVMEAGAGVFGIVREAGKDGKVIEGATLRVEAIETQSDAEGRYRIEGLNIAAFTLVAAHPDCGGVSVRLTPTAAAPMIERNVELTRGQFEARLIVKDSQTKEPLGGARVSVEYNGRVFEGDAAGLVHLKELARLSLSVTVARDGYSASDEVIDAHTPHMAMQVAPREILLDRGGMIRGVCTAGGTPLAGASVEIWLTNRRAATATTDSEGKYATESLPPGDYYVGIPAHGLAARPVNVPLEGATLDLEVGPVCHLRARLLRHGGQPHGSAGVYVYRRDDVYHAATVLTDPDGRLEAQNLFPGQWMLCVLKSQGDTAGQFAMPVSLASAGWSNIDVQLPQNVGVITGRVTYPGGGPVRNARVSVTNLGAGWMRACLSAYVLTDNQGWYRAERLENGAQMIARVGGYQDGAGSGTAFSDTVLVPANDTPVEANIVVPNTGYVVYAVFSRADGGPLLDASTIAYLHDAQGRVSGLYFGGGLTGGNVTLRDMVPGTYTLTVTSRGMKAAQLLFTMGEGSPTQVAVALEPELRNSG